MELLGLYFFKIFSNWKLLMIMCWFRIIMGFFFCCGLGLMVGLFRFFVVFFIFSMGLWIILKFCFLVLMFLMMCKNLNLMGIF